MHPVSWQSCSMADCSTMLQQSTGLPEETDPDRDGVPCYQVLVDKHLTPELTCTRDSVTTSRVRPSVRPSPSELADRLEAWTADPSAGGF